MTVHVSICTNLLTCTCTSDAPCDAVLHMTTSMHQHLTFPVRFLLGLHGFVWVQQFPRVISFALRLQTNPSCRTLGICMRHIRGVKNIHRHDPLCMQLHVVHYWACKGFLLGGRCPPPPPPPPENVLLEISNPDPKFNRSHPQSFSMFCFAPPLPVYSAVHT